MTTDPSFNPPLTSNRLVSEQTDLANPSTLMAADRSLMA